MSIKKHFSLQISIYIYSFILFLIKLLTKVAFCSIINISDAINATKKETIMFETLKAYLVDELHVKEEDITMEAELINDLGFNSLELADMVMACEEKFDVVIDDEDLHGFVTIGDIVRYLEAQKN